MTTYELLRFGSDRLRVSHWRGDRAVAVVHPAAAGEIPSAGCLTAAIDELARRGVTRVMTGALDPHEQLPFHQAGFVAVDELLLLARALTDLPPRMRVDNGSRIRRAHFRRDGTEAVRIDQSAFSPGWTLDIDGLRDALCATSARRFRLVHGTGGAYAIWGRSGDHGYLQRLAVEPNVQHNGLGRALVIDGLHWLRRHHCDEALVNTQVDNSRALRLYQRLGFVERPVTLSVLALDLAPETP